MRVPIDAVISICSDLSGVGGALSFQARFPVSSRNEIPNAGDIIEADLGDQYVNAYITEVLFEFLNAQVELSAQIVESFPTFSFDPSLLKQQLVSMFPHEW
jgi:hypothetical protein